MRRCVVLLLVAVLLGGCQPDRKAAAPDTVDLAGAVPWISAFPPPYLPPGPSPTPAVTTRSRPCGAADVRAAFGDGDGGGGHFVYGVRFENRSRVTCQLRGYPVVRVTEPGAPVVRATNDGWFPGTPGGDVLPGQHATLGVGTERDCAARTDGGPSKGPLYHRIRVMLAGGGTLTVAGPSGGLDVTCGVHLTAFSVDRPAPVELADPHAELTVELVLPRRARRGTVLSFVAVVRNPSSHAISMSPCPGYVERIGGVVKELHQLNCSGVRSIGPGQAVRFAMRLPLPATLALAYTTISWQLDGLLVNASGMVEITA